MDRDTRVVSDELDGIEPDDKDWTWVVERSCPECGFDGSTFSASTVGAAIRANAAEWVEVLDRRADELRRRAAPTRWTDLEYGAHVRDVYRIYLVRLGLMLGDDDPLFANWDQDETARVERYNDQEPTTVSAALVAAATDLADAFDEVTGSQWTRTGRRSDGAAFTVDTFARYLIHDPIHHLADVAAR